MTSGGTSSGDEQVPTSEANNASGTPSTHEGSGNGHSGRGGRWGKGKRGNINGFGVRHITSEPMERTLPNMARTLEGMVTFIQRSQLEVAEDRARVTTVNGESKAATLEDPALVPEKSAMELADQLTRGIKAWQERYTGEAVRA